ncbi:MAG: DUF4389 domain-containing protein [Lentisphaeria bacterium]|nr:DUF4389 domain-containing protein [Candidatus Neomarinimicrobiota bacterium]MCF7842190.1 DUF4389 domain-containing protein [Lentisphaeria bacterium]
MATEPINYPARLTIDYPEHLDRLTSFFRIITIIPMMVILGLLLGGSPDHELEREGWEVVYHGGGLVFFPTILMILFRQKYPRWWFDWNLALTRFCYRVFGYLILLRDEYPSTDEEQSYHIHIAYPDVMNNLHRGMPLVKWFLVLPHIIVLAFLYVAVVICTIIAWFSILFTGRYPLGMYEFVVGVLRWSLRVSAYAFLLTTDEYPPFSLS